MLSRLARYRDIVLYRIWAQLKSQARQNYLGYLWFALEPMLMTGIFFLVFGVLFESRSPQYLWFLTVGLIVWQWFETSLNEGMIGIKSKLHILSQIPLPKELFPLVHVGSVTWRFLCVLGITLLANIFWGPGFSWLWIFLPVVLLIQLFLTIGLVWLLAVAYSYFEDTQKVTQAVTRFLFYLSGIFFSAERIPAGLQQAFWANPLAILLQSYRDILVYHQMPSFSFLSYVAIWAIVLMVLGLGLCKHVDKRLIKEVVAS